MRASDRVIRRAKRPEKFAGDFALKVKSAYDDLQARKPQYRQPRGAGPLKFGKKGGGA